MINNKHRLGFKMYRLAKELFPICRSITGDGVRKTLHIIKKEIPLKICEVPSETKVFDWEVPMEWNIKEAWIKDPSGKKVVDFTDNNLHIVGYSTPINAEMPLSKLEEHLYSLPDKPDAIPYVTSYYKETWGFCLSQKVREKLIDGIYKIHIKSTLTNGSLTYGELIIKGRSKKEIFLSTNICHPSLANNEISGPALTTYLAKWIQGKPRNYTYRIIFIPETIGSLVYLSRNIDTMKNNIIAGFNITCVGDDHIYSFLPSRNGSTVADKIARRTLEKLHSGFKSYSFLDRGSDERQYCAPGIDLPVVSIMRSKYREYPEYHSSLDNLSLISPAGLQGSFDVLKECIETIEKNPRYQSIFLGEAQLGKRNLYPSLSYVKTARNKSRLYQNILAYADGTNDIEELERLIKIPKAEILEAVRTLLNEKLIKKI